MNKRSSIPFLVHDFLPHCIKTDPEGTIKYRLDLLNQCKLNKPFNEASV